MKRSFGFKMTKKNSGYLKKPLLTGIFTSQSVIFFYMEKQMGIKPESLLRHFFITPVLIPEVCLQVGNRINCPV